MAAGVIMNNPPAPHRPNNTPQTTLGTKPSTSGVQPQGTSGTRSALEVVDRILERARSRLEAGEAQATVETLEKVRRKHLLLTDRYTKSADDRCWISASESTRGRGDDVSGDS